MNKIIRTIRPFIILAILWEVSARLGLLDANTLPALSTIFERLYDLTAQGVIHRALLDSLSRLARGYAMAVFFGLLLGTLMSKVRLLDQMLSPSVSLLMAVPNIAWVPIFLVFLGLGDTMIITVVFLGGLFEITYATKHAMASVPHQYEEAARIMGAGPASRFFTVVLPASLLLLLQALRLALGYCWRALVGGEMLAAMAEYGLGKIMYDSLFFNDVAAMFVALMLLGTLGTLLDRMLFPPLIKTFRPELRLGESR